MQYVCTDISAERRIDQRNHWTDKQCNVICPKWHQNRDGYQMLSYYITNGISSYNFKIGDIVQSLYDIKYTFSRSLISAQNKCQMACDKYS